MFTLLDRVFRLEQYKTRSERDSAQLTYFIVLLLIAFFTVYAQFISGQNDSRSIFERALRGEPFSLVAVNAVYIFGFFTLLDIRLGWRSILREIGPLFMWVGSAVLFDVRDGLLQPTSAMSLASLVAIGALNLRPRGVLIAFSMALVAALVGLSRREIIPPDADTPDFSSDLFVIILQLFGIAALLLRLFRIITIRREESVQQIDTDRLRLAALTTQIAQRISGRSNLKDLLSTAVDEIQQRYEDIYHAQVFLIDDEGRTAQLVASTGEPGRLLLARQHALDVGSRSVIGQVTQNSEPVVARVGSSNSVHRRNEFLPDTAVEAAFPLQIGGRVIGALDLQSKLETAFAEDELPVFQSLADTIAVAIDNARLLEEAERRLRENERLIEQTRASALQVERLNRELTARSWDEYLESKGEQVAININFDRVTADTNAVITPTLQRAIEDNHVVQTEEGSMTVISAPLRVRGHIIGAMEFELPGGALTPEQLDLVQAVADRFGLAVETTRAYEVSRRAAQREAVLNEIGSRLQGRNRVEAVMEEAARGLQQTIGAQRVSIRLKTPRHPLELPENGGD